MNLSNWRVSTKLWVAFLGVMVALVTTAAVLQNRTVAALTQAIEDVSAIDERVADALRWRGMTERAVTMIVGGAMTSDAALAQSFDAKVKGLIVEVGAVQAKVVKEAHTDEENQALEKVGAERKSILEMVAKVRELKASGDAAAIEGFVTTQLDPQTVRYLGAQSAYVDLLIKTRDDVKLQAQALHTRLAALGFGIFFLVVTLGLLLVWRLVRSITLPLVQAVELADAIAGGDLTRQVSTDRKDELGHMLQALGVMSERLRGVVGDVRAGVHSVSSASIQIANGNHDLSARTEQTAANLEETASSMEELTATVTQSADTARQANQLAGTAAQAAARGGEVVGQVVTSMQQITESSRKISDIIGVIDGIAFQTNILALNAAVEAARAGEQGRGFAVVANEVRNLAGRSAEAAKEIKTLIGKSVENVESGSEQVAQAGRAMDEIVASVRRVSDLIGEITASSTEQRDGIGQVNQAVANLDQMTQQNAALVEESTAAATSMRDQAQRLAEVVSVFNVGAAAAQAPAPRPATAPRPAPAPRMASAPASARAAVAASPKAAPAPKLTSSAKAAAPAKAPAPAAKGNDDEWESF